MNLVIDIGNSVAKIALFNKNELTEIFYASNQSLDSLVAISKKYAVEKGILSTVVDLNDTIRSQLSKLNFELLMLTPQTRLPIKILYRTPQTLGSDRIAAVAGAQALRPQTNLLVIDAGTCITYEFIDERGNYLGGNISPGEQMRLKAIHAYTTRLPAVDAKGETPDIGFDTETAIRAGVIRGMEYEITGYISRFKKKYPDLLVFLTGGDEFSFETNLKNIIFADKFLVLKGLNRILEYNDKI